MGTKTPGITEDVYQRLAARKRDDESFTGLIDRQLTEARPNWREGFGELSEAGAVRPRTAAEASRASLGRGLAACQDRALDAMVREEDTDETA